MDLVMLSEKYSLEQLQEMRQAIDAWKELQRCR
jgi:hypothetical protein